MKENLKECKCFLDEVQTYLAFIKCPVAQKLAKSAAHFAKLADECPCLDTVDSNCSTTGCATECKDDHVLEEALNELE